MYIVFIVKPRIMDRDKLLPVRIKRGQPFNIDVNYIGEPTPTITWKRKTLVGGNPDIYFIDQDSSYLEYGFI
jgi:hypothetical protein